jgi:hypothetical protein
MHVLDTNVYNKMLSGQLGASVKYCQLTLPIAVTERMHSLASALSNLPTIPSTLRL